MSPPPPPHTSPAQETTNHAPPAPWKPNGPGTVAHHQGPNGTARDGKEEGDDGGGRRGGRRHAMTRTAITAITATRRLLEGHYNKRGRLPGRRLREAQCAMEGRSLPPFSDTPCTLYCRPRQDPFLFDRLIPQNTSYDSDKRSWDQTRI